MRLFLESQSVPNALDFVFGNKTVGTLYVAEIFCKVIFIHCMMDPKSN